MRRLGRLTVHTVFERGYELFGLTLLVMPEAERRWQRRDEDEEPVEDSYDRFVAGGWQGK